MTVKSQASDLYRVLVKLLADGEWHDYGTIVAMAAKTVQPGAAMRKCEHTRLAALRRRGVGEERPRVKSLSVEEQIRAGSRQLVRQRLGNSKAFEIDPRGVTTVNAPKRVRLRPGPTVPPDARRSPWTQAALDLLLDGVWHDQDEVVRHAMTKVPPERALKQASGTRAPTGRSRNIDERRLIEIGARAIAYAGIKGNSMIEVDRSGTRPMMRLKGTR